LLQCFFARFFFFFVFFFFSSKLSFLILFFNIELVKNYSYNHSFKTRPGPRPGFRVLTGSLGRPGQFFFLKKSKRHRFSKKTKQKLTGLQPGLDRVLPGHTGFFLPPFFLQPGPVLAPGQPVGLGRVLKLWLQYVRKSL
jgi:hypothetical protein